jgi:hypothetical protein
MTTQFFRDQSDKEDDFFYEGPAKKPDLYKGPAYATNHVNVIGIDTREIDKFRQGVEITSNVAANANVYRIYSGEAGHKTFPNAYGQGKNFRTTATNKFIENFPYSPSEWLDFTGAKLFKDQLLEVGGIENQNEKFGINGTIEPLVIRLKITRQSIDTPFESHDVRAQLMEGNANIFFGSSRIVNVDYFDPEPHGYPFYDLYIDDLPQKDPKKYYSYSAVPIDPFVDRQRSYDFETQVQGDDIIAAVNASGISDAGYIQPNEVSARTGFIYSTKNNVGVDSIAYGDLTFY